MGRKIEMKKIEEITKRQVTFSKRRTSLTKKAEEIAVCCDVDVLFVAFSPSGRINKFCTKKSIEDFLLRYMNLPVERRLTHIADVQEKMDKLRRLNHINGDVSKLHYLEKQVENWELQIKKSTLELQILDASIRDYEPGEDQEPSLHQLYWCERNLKQSLQKVAARKMELEKQSKISAQPFHFAAQQTASQQPDHWISPYSAINQENVFEGWIDKGKRVTCNSSNYGYNVPFASSSQCGNISCPQIQNTLPSYVPMQNEQQNMVVDHVQQIPAQAYGQSQAQVNFGESSGNSIFNLWTNLCTSTRPISGPFSTMGTKINNPSQLESDYVHSNWNAQPYPGNINSNSNNSIHITQDNYHSSVVQSDARVLNGCNYAVEGNIMGNNQYFVQRTQENDPWEWEDSVLNETFSVEDFSNLD